EAATNPRQPRAIFHPVAFTTSLSRSHHNFDPFILLIPKIPVGVWRLVDTQSMSTQEGRIHSSFLDVLKQAAHVSMDMRLSHSERQALGEGSSERQLINDTSIDTRHRDDAILAAALDDLPECVSPVGFKLKLLLHIIISCADPDSVSLQPDGIDTFIWSGTTRQIMQRFEHTLLFVIDQVSCPGDSREVQAFSEPVDGDDLCRIQESGTPDGE